MQRSEQGRLTALLLAVVAVLGGLPLLKGGFYLGKHEGDTLHMTEIVLRMARGQWPHLDFMTPIGVLAAAPIAWFVHMGAGIGHAIFYAQILVALILLPATVRVASSRIEGPIGWLYAAFVMVFCLALVHGEAERSVSISMHYNRWAWAITYIIVPLVMLAPRDGQARPRLDGAIIGLGMAALLLIKATYFVSLAPAVLIGLLVRRWWASLGAAVIAGLGVAALITALAGVGFWMAYLGDLLTVARSDIRPQPGEPFGVIAAAPAYMGASLTMLATVIFLRQAGRMTEGLLLLILMPGFLYIVFQNFGNDPQWLMLLAMLAFVLRPEPGALNGWGWDMRQALSYAAALAVAFGFPSAINLAYSPFRHMASDTAETVPLLPHLAQHHDIFAIGSRLYRVDFTRSGDGPGTDFAAYRPLGKRDKEIASLNGETLPECTMASGMLSWFEVVSADLEKAGYGGKGILGTDLFSFYWMFGDFRPVKGAAPWYYGGLSGLADADYVLVPLCPMAPEIRAGMLKDLAASGRTLHEVRRTGLYILLETKAP